MKLARIQFDDMVCIALGRDNGSAAPRSDLRDSSFAASDGWDLTETAPGVFRICRDGMPAPVTIGGYGYTFTEALELEPAPKKGKR